MTELGVGSRVFVGYTDSTDGKADAARCKTGTIVDGPRPPGEIVICFGTLMRTSETEFSVMMDYGEKIEAAEPILTPIDGDEGLNDEPTMSEIPKEEA